MRKKIGTHDAMGETIPNLSDGGLLLVSGVGGNPMTIGWGTIGQIWGRPVFLVLVRPSRHSFSLLESLPEYTVCVPGPDLKKAVAVCGSRSGRDIDKVKECGLSLTRSETIGVPYVEECRIHYECRVIHKSNVVNADLSPEIVAKSYPAGDFHRVYYGEILGVYREDG